MRPPVASAPGRPGADATNVRGSRVPAGSTGDKSACTRQTGAEAARRETKDSGVRSRGLQTYAEAARHPTQPATKGRATNTRGSRVPADLRPDDRAVATQVRSLQTHGTPMGRPAVDSS